MADIDHRLILRDSGLFPEDAVIEKQGQFDYHLNDTKASISEPWLQYTTSTHTGTLSARIIEDAELIIYSDCRQRQDNGHLQIIIDWQYCQHSQFLARYYIRDNKLHWQVNRHHGQQPINDRQCFFPLMRVFMGSAVHALANGLCNELIVPDIRTLDDSDTVLRPYNSQRSASLIENEAILELANQSLTVEVFQYQSDIYQANAPARCFIDNDGLLRRYTWQQSPERNWRVDNQVFD
ncbi:hypothetical protein [Thalassotalea mangrovi]|uniref:Uncharacterized protein n=1 Tax=Thalassotalea mangrovi TaxID=2572245 RepID=A0A4U1B6N5_9GAMM|nr:hypothetical protein [Thalassotalea mangrovi]TKB46057.1 hypothetical protein E8M12_05360 [Thalassotalea mangrovi]